VNTSVSLSRPQSYSREIAEEPWTAQAFDLVGPRFDGDDGYLHPKLGTIEAKQSEPETPELPNIQVKFVRPRPRYELEWDLARWAVLTADLNDAFQPIFASAISSHHGWRTTRSNDQVPKGRAACRTRPDFRALIVGHRSMKTGPQLILTPLLSCCTGSPRG
jgi:hypothetical protein